MVTHYLQSGQAAELMGLNGSEGCIFHAPCLVLFQSAGRLYIYADDLSRHARYVELDHFVAVRGLVACLSRIVVWR